MSKSKSNVSNKDLHVRMHFGRKQIYTEYLLINTVRYKLVFISIGNVWNINLWYLRTGTYGIIPNLRYCFPRNYGVTQLAHNWLFIRTLFVAQLYSYDICICINISVQNAIGIRRHLTSGICQLYYLASDICIGNIMAKLIKELRETTPIVSSNFGINFGK